MAFVTLEDLHGSCEVLVFSKVFAEAEAILKSDAPILVKGALISEGDDEQGTQLKIRAQSIEPLGEVRRAHAQSVHVTVDVSLADAHRLGLFKQTLKRHYGPVPVHLCLISPTKFEADLTLGSRLYVSPNEELLREVTELFGRGCVSLR